LGCQTCHKGVDEDRNEQVDGSDRTLRRKFNWCVATGAEPVRPGLDRRWNAKSVAMQQLAAIRDEQGAVVSQIVPLL
jgi:hypothetical protein